MDAQRLLAASRMCKATLLFVLAGPARSIVIQSWFLARVILIVLDYLSQQVDYYLLLLGLALILVRLRQSSLVNLWQVAPFNCLAVVGC